MDGRVIFSGGEDHGENYVYVNPTHATPVAQSDSGEVTSIHWWITPKGSNTILYEGNSTNSMYAVNTIGTPHSVDAALTQMKQEAPQGEYMLNFTLECESGTTHNIGRNFYIRT